MRLALLGLDDVTRAVAREVRGGVQHEVTTFSALDPNDAPRCQDELMPLAPQASYVEGWESLLDRGACDAVLVARAANKELLADALRKLVQAGVPTVVAHPALDSMLTYYELDMIRRETGCVLLPYFPQRWHPALAKLGDLFPGEPDVAIGTIEQVVIERQIAERSREIVLEQFARDALLVAALCGKVARVGAMGGGQTAFANLSVQMTVPHDALVRWSVSPVDQAPLARLTLVGGEGKAVLTMPKGAEPWTLETRVGGDVARREFADWRPAQTMLDKLQRAIAREPIGLDWPSAAQSVELAETIDRSLAKGRTIELHYEDHSETNTFKGAMTSLGCGIIVLATLLLAVAVATGKHVVMQIVAGGLLGLLGLFLALQSLLVLLRRDKDDR